MSRMIFAFAALLFLVPEAPAEGQTSGSGAQSAQRCENSTARRRGSRIIGGIGGRLLGRAGVPTSVAGVGLPTQELLSDAIINLLDCREQQQAAAATNEAVRGGVGTTTNWQSETRPGVSGSSTVTAQRAETGGGDCMTVTDIIIVNGEETRAPKTLCRRPPSQRYVRV